MANRGATKYVPDDLLREIRSVMQGEEVEEFVIGARRVAKYSRLWRENKKKINVGSYL